MGCFGTVTRGKIEGIETDAGWGLADVVGAVEVWISSSFSVKLGAKSLAVRECGKGLLEVSGERKCELVP